MLGTLVLTFHHDAAGQMGDADGRIGFVDVLTTRPGRAVGVDAQVAGVDVDLFDLRQFRQHRHGGGGGMNATLRLGDRYPLHPVRAVIRTSAANTAP